MAHAPSSSFQRLAQLLEGVSPETFPTGKAGPIALTVGEPQDIPGVGRFISVIDTEGNRVSMLQPTRP